MDEIELLRNEIRKLNLIRTALDGNIEKKFKLEGFEKCNYDKVAIHIYKKIGGLL